MNLSELRTFLSIVDTGSLVRAAHQLNVTQSTVTARLQTLEAELGQTLINRARSGATLTAAGMRLYRYADTINDLWQQARQETALPKGLSGMCNVACEGDLWGGLGAALFDQLRSDHPDLALSVWLGSATDVANWLADGKSDLAITYRAAALERQDQIELAADHLILVSTNAASPIRFDPIYVYVEGGEAFGRDHAAAYADASTAQLSFGNATLARDHILANGGSAYLPARLVADDLAKGVLHQLLDAPTFHRRIYLTANQSAVKDWPWFDATIARFRQRQE